MSELGFALREMPTVGTGEIHAASGVFSEACVLLEDAAARVEVKAWSSCPCGQDHGQTEADRGVVLAFRKDARLAKAIAA